MLSIKLLLLIYSGCLFNLPIVFGSALFTLVFQKKSFLSPSFVSSSPPSPLLSYVSYHHLSGLIFIDGVPHKIIKRKNVVFDNLAKFLSISPNQTKFLPSVCLVPAGLFCHSFSKPLVSLRMLSTYILLDFKVAKWAVSSLTHCSNAFQVNMFTSRFIIQMLHIITAPIVY